MTRDWRHPSATLCTSKPTAVDYRLVNQASSKEQG